MRRWKQKCGSGSGKVSRLVVDVGATEWMRMDGKVRRVLVEEGKVEVEAVRVGEWYKGGCPGGCVGGSGCTGGARSGSECG